MSLWCTAVGTVNLPCFYGIQIIPVPEQQDTDALYLHLLSNTCIPKAAYQTRSPVIRPFTSLRHASKTRWDTPFGRSSGFNTGMKFPPTSASAAAPLFSSLVLASAPCLLAFVSAVKHTLKVIPMGEPYNASTGNTRTVPAGSPAALTLRLLHPAMSLSRNDLWCVNLLLRCATWKAQQVRTR